MSALLPHRALHLVSASGGGMTRFARDLCELGDAHALLHAATDTWVAETGRGDGTRYTPYRLPSGDDVAAWLDALLTDRACELLHVHHLHADTLPLLEAWCARGRPWIASLHDVGFLRADAFVGGDGLPQVDVEWSARWQRVLATAAAITAPSAFLAGVFANACRGLLATLVAPGVALPETAPRPPRPPLPLRSIAIVGALGAHKGKERLLRWLAHPAAARYRWTLIGYTEDQLHPGWLADGRLRVHGPFLPECTSDWLRHYDVDLVIFPNRLAESFSYALSDVWAAGVPVLAPDIGALGERVHAHGGGASMSFPDDADSVHLQLAELADDGGAMLAQWRVEIAERRSAMVPTIASMVDAMARIYERIAVADAKRVANVDKLQPYLRTQLDDIVFRHENIRLARDYAQVRAWADKLERDVARLDIDLRKMGDLRGVLDRQLRERDDAIEALRTRNEAVESDAAALRARNLAVEADAARLAAQVRALGEQGAAQTATIAELSVHRLHLSVQLGAEQQRAALLAEVCDAHAGELAIMHQRINALEVELRPLRIKGARYDRALGWLPASLRCLLRGLRDMRQQRQLARGER
jgi:glycosyltransferase involved in cell wall biosynthesis